MTLCAYLLRNAKDTETLTKSGEQLARTYGLYPKTPTQEEYHSFLYLRGIYYAMIGEPEEARKSLQGLTGDQDFEEDVKKVQGLLPSK